MRIQLDERSGMDRRTGDQQDAFMEQRSGIDRREVVRDAERVVSVMRSIPLFRGFSEEQYMHILRICSKIVLPRRKVLIRRGEVSDALYVLITGRVKLLFNEFSELTIIEPFGTIGEVGMFTCEPRNVSAAAMEDSTLLKIGRQELLRVLEANTAQSRTLLTNVIDILAHKMRDERRIIERFHYRCENRPGIG